MVTGNRSRKNYRRAFRHIVGQRSVVFHQHVVARFGVGERETVLGIDVDDALYEQMLSGQGMRKQATGKSVS